MRHLVSLNQEQVRTDADGKIRYVVSPRDRGVPNWLDTAGNATGFVFPSWQGLPAPLRENESPSAEVVKLSELRARLPAETPVVDAAARAEQLAVRRHARLRR